MSTAMDYEAEPATNYEDEPRAYDRERSRSPRGERRRDDGSRARSASPNDRDRMESREPQLEPRSNPDDEAPNTGTNLFVTGIHPSLSEEEVTRLFAKYGDVEKCNIMRDPHTRESRGFGFVNMMTPEQAEAAREGLHGEEHQGRKLSIERARRSRPRTPTPGKYFGPPKREFRGGRGGGRFGDRFDDRRGGYGRREEYGSYRSSRYDRYEDRGYGDRYEDRGYSDRRRDDYPRNIDRYASRDDRYGGRSDDRRGYYDREDRSRGGAGGSYGESAPRDNHDGYSGGGGSKSYDDREPTR